MTFSTKRQKLNTGAALVSPRKLEPVSFTFGSHSIPQNASGGVFTQQADLASLADSSLLEFNNNRPNLERDLHMVKRKMVVVAEDMHDCMVIMKHAFDNHGDKLNKESMIPILMDLSNKIELIRKSAAVGTRQVQKVMEDVL